MTKPNAKPGRPRESSKPRQQLSASVSQETCDTLGLWCVQLQLTVPAAHIGRVLDLLVRFGKERGFILPTIASIKKPLRPSGATGAPFPTGKEVTHHART